MREDVWVRMGLSHVSYLDRDTHDCLQELLSVESRRLVMAVTTRRPLCLILRVGLGEDKLERRMRAARGKAREVNGARTRNARMRVRAEHELNGLIELNSAHVCISCAICYAYAARLCGHAPLLGDELAVAAEHHKTVHADVEDIHLCEWCERSKCGRTEVGETWEEAWTEAWKDMWEEASEEVDEDAVGHTSASRPAALVPLTSDEA